MANRLARTLLLLAAATLLPGCASFSAVRSAEVRPGPALSAQASLASPPGEEAYWFFALGCAVCDHPVAALDLGFTYGAADPETERPYEFGAGVNGLFPYVSGYVQLDGGEGPAYGVGARLGIPFPLTWSLSQIYGRYDHGLPSGRRVLFNPTVFVHAGDSPNRENPGVLLGVAPAAGLAFEGKQVTITPSVAPVLVFGRRESDGVTGGSFATLYLAAAVSVVLHPLGLPSGTESP